MMKKFLRFWQMPLLNKVYVASVFCSKIKGRVFYRFLFKHFGVGSYIRKPLLVLNASYIDIGDSVSILDGARLEVLLSNDRRIPTLSIGNNTNIEQNVHIICHSRIRIGDNVSITGNCSIVDATHPFSDGSDPVKIGHRILDEDSYVEIGDGSFIGFGSVILPNVRIGANCVVGANSVVSHDVPPFSVVSGVPAVIVSRMHKGLAVKDLGDRHPEVHLEL